MTRRVLLVRHASAGDRDAWPGDDDLRPLDARGRRQAAALVEQLKPVAPAGRVLSSPSVRCVQTVEPLAAARGVAVERTPDLAEGTGLRVLDLARAGGDGDAFCTHGDVINETLGYLYRHRVVGAGARAEKGSTWVLELDGQEIVGARYLPAPA